MRSSIRPSLISPGAVDCKMNTREKLAEFGADERERVRTIFVSHTLAYSNARLLVRVVQTHGLCELDS